MYIDAPLSPCEKTMSPALKDFSVRRSASASRSSSASPWKREIGRGGRKAASKKSMVARPSAPGKTRLRTGGATGPGHSVGARHDRGVARKHAARRVGAAHAAAAAGAVDVATPVQEISHSAAPSQCTRLAVADGRGAARLDVLAGDGAAPPARRARRSRRSGRRPCTRRRRERAGALPLAQYRRSTSARRTSCVHEAPLGHQQKGSPGLARRGAAGRASGHDGDQRLPAGHAATSRARRVHAHAHFGRPEARDPVPWPGWAVCWDVVVGAGGHAGRGRLLRRGPLLRMASAMAADAAAAASWGVTLRFANAPSRSSRQRSSSLTMSFPRICSGDHDLLLEHRVEDLRRPRRAPGWAGGSMTEKLPSAGYPSADVPLSAHVFEKTSSSERGSRVTVDRDAFLAGGDRRRRRAASARRRPRASSPPPRPLVVLGERRVLDGHCLRLVVPDAHVLGDLAVGAELGEARIEGEMRSATIPFCASDSNTTGYSARGSSGRWPTRPWRRGSSRRPRSTSTSVFCSRPS